MLTVPRKLFRRRILNLNWKNCKNFQQRRSLKSDSNTNQKHLISDETNQRAKY